MASPEKGLFEESRNEIHPSLPGGRQIAKEAVGISISRPDIDSCIG
jgi:hypothetical protein